MWHSFAAIGRGRLLAGNKKSPANTNGTHNSVACLKAHCEQI